MKTPSFLKREQVERFERVRGHLEALAEELGILSKKASDAKLNNFKLSIVNERLRTANSLLSGAHQPFENFREFDDHELPSASDVVVVLTQYLSSLEDWRSANVVLDMGYWYWNTKERDLETVRPTRAYGKGTQ